MSQEQDAQRMKWQRRKAKTDALRMIAIMWKDLDVMERNGSLTAEEVRKMKTHLNPVFGKVSADD